MRTLNKKKKNIININKIKTPVADFAKKTILNKVSIKVICGLKLFMQLIIKKNNIMEAYIEGSTARPVIPRLGSVLYLVITKVKKSLLKKVWIRPTINHI